MRQSDHSDIVTKRPGELGCGRKTAKSRGEVLKNCILESYKMKVYYCYCYEP